MRLLLDMGLSPRTAQVLRDAGHDVVHFREQHLHLLPDEAVMAKGADEARVVVTFDLDFARLMALQRRSHPSVVLFRLTKFTTDHVNTRLLEMVDRFERELTVGAIIVVDENKVRLRELPIW